MIKPSEKIFLALIMVTFLLPAPLALWIHRAKLGPQFNWFDRANPGPQFDWIANQTLYGVTMKSDLPSVSLAGWLSGDLQKGLNTLVSENIAGRELLIRIFNQTLYSAFHKSYMMSRNDNPWETREPFRTKLFGSLWSARRAPSKFGSRGTSRNDEVSFGTAEES